jgi:hypothetical protein
MDTRVSTMPAQNPSRDEELVADARPSLYEVRSSSGRNRRHEGIAIARAAILVALMGGALWYLLWNFAAHLWGMRESLHKSATHLLFR